jgi:hypothetical protein
MKFVTRPPVNANGVGHGGDDLDEALFAFFRSEMPSPWPQLKLPNGTPPAPALRPARPAPAPSQRPWFRSPRFALAASVALLIAGYATMSATLSPPAAPDVTRLGGSDKANAHNPKDVVPPDDDGVGVDFESLDQVGNTPTTIHIKVFKNK